MEREFFWEYGKFEIENNDNLFLLKGNKIVKFVFMYIFKLND